MKDERKTKKQLIEELDQLRCQVAESGATDTGRKQAEEWLKESEAKYSAVVERANDGISMSKNGHIVFANKAMARITGYSISELEGKALAELMTLASAQYSLDIVRKRMSGKPVPSVYEVTALCKDGTTKDVEISAGMISYMGEQASLAVIRDITKRKKIENALRESEEKYRNVVERANDVIVIIQDGIVQYANPLTSDLMGYTPGEAIGVSMTNFIHPDEMEIAIDRYTRRLAGEDVPPIYETALVHKDGHRIEVELSGGVIKYEGRPADLVIIRGISERKQVEKALQQSEEKYRTLLDNAGTPIMYYDLNGICILMNNVCAANLGGVPDDFLGKSVYDISPNVADLTFERFRQTLESGTTGFYEDVFHLPSGDLWFSSYFQTVNDSGGNPIAIQITAQDVTERKKMEEALRDSEERWKSLTNNTDDIIQILDIEGNIQYMNKVYPPHTMEDVLGKPVFDFMDAESQQSARKAIDRLAEEKTPQDFEIVIILPGHDNAYFHVKYVPIMVDGEVRRIISHVSDVTKRKRAEEALRKNEALLNTTQQLAKIGGWEWDLKSGDMSWTDEIFRIHDFDRGILSSSEEYIQMSSECYDPEDRPVIMSAFTRCLENGESYDLELPFTTTMGRRIWVRTVTEALFEGERVVKVFGNIMDITDRKKIEEALRESEERWKSLTNNTNDIIQILDIEGNIQYMNKVYPPHTMEDVIGKPVFEFMDDISQNSARRAIDRLVKEKTPQEFTIVIFLPEHDDAHFAVKYVPILVDGEVHRIISHVSDITEREKSKNALIESESKYRLLIENFSDPIWVFDRDGVAIMVNSAGAKPLGGIPSDFIGKSITEFLPNAAEQSLERNRQIIESGEGGNFEDMFELPTGKMWTWSNLQPVKDNAGNITGVQIIAYDITERKRAEEALRKSETLLNTTQQLAKVGGWEFDLENRSIVWTDELYRIHDFDPGKLASREEYIQSSLECYDPEDRPVVSDAFNRCVEKGEAYDLEFPFTTAKGRRIWIRTITQALMKGEKVIKVFGNIMEITERKQAVESLRESEEKYRLLADNTGDFVAMTDMNAILTYVSPSHTKLGYDPFVMIGTLGHSYVRQEDIPYLVETIGPLYDPDIIAKQKESGEKLPEIMMDYKVFDAWGNTHHIESITNLIIDQYGENHSVVNVSRDITERKQAESDLRKSEERFRALTENALDAITVLEADGTVRFATKSASLMLGFQPDESNGGIEFELIYPDDVQQVADSFAEVLNVPGSTITMEELRIRHKDGSWHILEIVAKNLLNDPAINGIVVNQRDVTDRKQAETELTRYREHLEELVEERTIELQDVHEKMLRQERLATLGEFSGSISHELRNPLGVIDSSAYFLKNRLVDADDKTVEHLNRIKSSVITSTSIIESILNLTRMREPHLEEINIAELLKESTKSDITPHSVRVVEDYSEQDITIKADREQLRMAFKNIIKNAVDAMEGQGILTVATHIGSGNMVEISFTDTGPGIPPENIGRIFQPLFSSKAKGIGFGLSIVNLIAEKHGGTVKARSKEGEGSEITMELPLAKS